MPEAEQRAAVVAEALTWQATPYHHHARIKAAGVDCVQLLCAVYEACGLIEHVDPGVYATDWHLHHSEELYIAGLLKHAHQVERPQVGDAVLFRFGRCYSHGGLLVAPDTVLHAYINRGVILTRLDEEPLAGRPMQAWSMWK
jgi:NlpC/P60 family putative phage cell wall peptidase